MILTPSGAVTDVLTLPLRMSPEAKPNTAPASIRFFALIVGPPLPKLPVFQVFAFIFSHDVGYMWKAAVASNVPITNLLVELSYVTV